MYQERYLRSMGLLLALFSLTVYPKSRKEVELESTNVDENIDLPICLGNILNGCINGCIGGEVQLNGVDGETFGFELLDNFSAVREGASSDDYMIMIVSSENSSGCKANALVGAGD